MHASEMKRIEMRAMMGMGAAQKKNTQDAKKGLSGENELWWL
jgi:hypothetical protein